MKPKSFLSLCILAIASTSCGNKNNASYDFSTGSNFSNICYAYENETPPYFFEEYDSQVEENYYFDFDVNFDNLVNAKVLEFTNPGIYRLRGTSYDSSIVINTIGDITLIFDNLNLTCQETSVIKVIKAQNFSIKVPSKTMNYLTDSLNNRDRGVIDSNVDISISGQGFLNISSYGNDQTLKEYGHAIYTDGNLNIDNARIVTEFSVHHVFKALGNFSVNNSKIDIGFCLENGIYSNKNLSFINSLYIYNGTNTSIYANENIVIYDSKLFIESRAKFNVIKYDENLDFSKPVFCRNDNHYNRIDKEEYNSKRTFYSLVKRVAGVCSKLDIDLINSYIDIQSDDVALYCEDDLTSLNTEYVLHVSNYGIYAKDQLAILNEPHEDKKARLIKIFNSYKGISGRTVEIYNGEYFINSLNTGIGCHKNIDSSYVKLLNNTYVQIDTKKYGVANTRYLEIDNSGLSILGSNKDHYEPINFDEKFVLNNSFLLTLENVPQKTFLTGVDQEFIRFSHHDKLRKNSALSVVSKNFSTSIISSKTYPNPSLTLTSPDMKDGSYDIVKNGVIDYKFVNNISIKEGKPFEGKRLDTIVI